MDLNPWISRIRTVLGIIHGERTFGAPLQVNLGLTNRCNLRCIHCYFYSPHAKIPNYHDVLAARKRGGQFPRMSSMRKYQKIHADSTKLRVLVEEMLEMGIRRWQIGGRGEPFMHEDALALMRRLKQSGSYCLANTNGTLLDHDVADELIRIGFDELRITTLAGTPDAYVRTHAGVSKETFGKLADTLLYIAEQKAALGVKNPKITLVLVVLKQNTDEILNFARFADKIKAERVFYRPVDDVGDSGLAELVPTEEQALIIWNQLKKAESYLCSKGILHNIQAFRNVFLEKLNTRALYQVVPCYYGWLAVMVEPDGEVFPCCRCYESLGNVYEQEFREIWYGGLYRRFRKEAMQLNTRLKPVRGCDCNTCVQHTANLRTYQVLHPLKGRSVGFELSAYEKSGEYGL